MPTVVGNVGFAASASLGLNVVDPQPFVYNGVLADTASGALGLMKLGSGTLVSTAANTYSGPTTIAAGTFQLGDGTTNGSLSSPTIADSGVLAFNNAGAELRRLH